MAVAVALEVILPLIVVGAVAAVVQGQQVKVPLAVAVLVALVALVVLVPQQPSLAMAHKAQVAGPTQAEQVHQVVLEALDIRVLQAVAVEEII